VFENILNNINNNAPHPKSEYVGEDGLLHCSVCHVATQTKIEILGQIRTVRCICDCRKKELEAFEQRKAHEERERKRNICFSESNMAQWTFANDDGNNAKLSEAMQNYVKNFTEFRKTGKGLLLYGTVGTGKTYFAAAIANALIDKDYKVLMTNFASLTNKIQGMFEGKQQYYDRLNSCPLLVLDDLSAERKTEYMQEIVFNVIDARYRANLPIIVTTNLTREELLNPADLTYQRIFSRLFEMCTPIEVVGKDRRQKALREDIGKMKNLLGLE
jgi:DNA replication protein DnaC